ncbi:unnamed protein product, partial [Iphiclides podalirius]
MSGKPLVGRGRGGRRVNIARRPDKGFCRPRRGASAGRDARGQRRCVAWSEARAPAPPPPDKPGATPPGDAYAPLGAGAVRRAPPAAPRQRRRQTGPRASCTAPTLLSQLHRHPPATFDGEERREFAPVSQQRPGAAGNNGRACSLFGCRLWAIGSG